MIAAALFAAISLTSLVDPFLGTSGTVIGGPIDTFPGADTPFGMVQWSPDTPSQNAGGGYEFTDKEITGFSLTHLSGPGCSVFGDFAMLPTTGDVTKPEGAKQSFSHASEVAAPGYYAVTLGDPGIRSELTVTPRAGLGQFTFPSTTQANILISPSSNQAGVTSDRIRIRDNQDVEAMASSGFFCGMPDRYTVYYVAHFDRPFTASGQWGFQKSASGGAWVRFDTTKDPVVRVRVAISFVDMDGARRNLASEATTWSLTSERNAALASWSALLSRVQVSGANTSVQRQFYTALYHALLHPNLVSDSDGRYMGFDNAVHRVRPGHAEYGNYSDWDIYRTQVPLVSLLVPDRASDMMQSLVDAYSQSGWLPRWPVVNQPSSVMGGDSPDPILAGGYAFGARNFDTKTALAAMMKGSSDTTSPIGYGWYLERPQGAEYNARGYIPNLHTTSVSPVPNGASETLEYALDDASIAAFAQSLGRSDVYATYVRKGANWSNIFDTTQGLIAPRDENGAFLHTPITDSGQSGFQEGNAAQYTWMVPQDLPHLIEAMGGRQAAAAKLDTFFSQLNADQNKPYAWMGNEPSIGSPYAYLSVGEPWRTQEIVRTVISTLYNDTPDGIPGNDDLGTMSAWYVWSALGLYPQMPAERRLDIGSPIFTRALIAVPNGPRIRIDAPSAALGAPYVQAVAVNGKAMQHTWIDLPLHGNTTLAFTMGSSPNKQWGRDPSDAPPALAPATVTLVPATTAAVVLDQTSLVLAPGETQTITGRLTFSDGRPVDVVMSVSSQDGLSATKATSPQGTIAVHVHADRPGLYNVLIGGAAPNGAKLQNIVVNVRVARPNEVLPLAWIANRFDNTVMPYDLRTHALGARIPVDQEPRDGVLTPDNARYFVADRGGKAVSVVDTASMRTIAKIAVGNAPCGTAITPDGSHVWVADYDDGTITGIDTHTLKASAPISVGKGARFITISPDASRLYVTNQAENTITPVDLRTNTALAPVPVGQRPTGIAISPDGKRIYVANNATEDVTVLDAATLATIASPKAGVEAQMVAISPDGTFAYVPNFSTITVTPIDLRTNTSLPDLRVGGQPFDVQWLRDGSAALVMIRRDNALVWIDRNGHVSAPQFLGSGGAYTIAIPH